jgi:hypothetical protein
VQYYIERGLVMVFLLTGFIVAMFVLGVIAYVAGVTAYLTRRRLEDDQTEPAFTGSEA